MSKQKMADLERRLEEAQQELGWAIKSDGTCPSCGNPYFVSRSYEKDKDCFDVEIPVLHCGNCGESFCQHDAMLIRDMRRSLEEAQQKIVAQQAQLKIAITTLRSIETEYDHGGELSEPRNFPKNLARYARIGIEHIEQQKSIDILAAHDAEVAADVIKAVQSTWPVTNVRTI